jgi:hypothetical protein
METFKSVAVKLTVSTAGWVLGTMVLGMTIGWFLGLVVATLLAVTGFVIWLYVDHPKLGGFVASVVFDPEGDFDDSRRRAEEEEQDRLGRDYMERYRRGDRRDST